MGVKLKPVHWALATNNDLFDNDKSNIPSGFGLRQAATAQVIYYRDGSIREYAKLAALLAKSGTLFPDADWVRAQLTEIDLINYEFTENGPIWRLANISPEVFPDPFGAGYSRSLFFGDDERNFLFPAEPETLKRQLSLFHLLSGDYTLQDVLAKSDPAMIDLLKTLVAEGVLYDFDNRLDELPDFLFLGHSSFMINSGKTKVVVDPLIIPENRVTDRIGRSQNGVINSADYIAISHFHWDHLHFQTLCSLDRSKKLIVPKVRTPGFANPPIASYLKHLGFSNVIEVSPGDRLTLGDIAFTAFPFHGESFGLNSVFDAFTYHFEFAGKTLYGSVDASFDEAADMEETISQVAALGDLDIFLFGSSGLTHTNPIKAAGLRYLSNELQFDDAYLRYHPTVEDAERWIDILKPRCTIPYAQFLFDGRPLPDLRFEERAAHFRSSLEAAREDQIKKDHDIHWFENLVAMADRAPGDMVCFQPLQGMTF